MMRVIVQITVIVFLISVVTPAVIIEADTTNRFKYINPTSDDKLLLEDKNYWYNVGNEYLEKILEFDQKPKEHVAKNVVIFLGDGMGMSTVAATRIYKGQRLFGKSGEEHNLIFDTFPNVALVKTYSVDMQVPDSAATATALFTGVKTRYEAVGVDVKANKSEADAVVFEKSKLEGIMSWAQQANKDTGIITTTRITHATPAATYAHIHHRDWECDSEVPEDFKPLVKDIARQLVEDSPGNKFKVILGGGYQQLGHITHDASDGECVRTDGLNLTQAWIDRHKGMKAGFVTNTQDLINISDETEYLLGLFHPDHVPYELVRDNSFLGTPSLLQMTQKGLNILSRNSNGFVLLVEGGKIDLAHHENYARIALEEAAEFDKTIAFVMEKCSSDTLIIVTADHSHTLTINGYSKRGNDILGYGIENEDDKPALTLAYANGPGFAYQYTSNESSILGPWLDPRADNNRLEDPYYQHLATFELDDETHSGEDVGIYATGPGSHLIRGVIEQNYVGHLISYSACIGPRAILNPHCKENINNSSTKFSQFSFIVVLWYCLMFIFILY